MKPTAARLPIIKQIFDVLARDLPKSLRYHGLHHTKDVLDETLLFAMHDHVDDRGIELLSIAAAFHDAGYIERYDDNEEIGAAMASAAMRAAGGYSASEIREVEEMILSTQLLQSTPAMIRVERTPLAGYLMDADLGAFGRDDFFEKCEQLMEETGLQPEVFYRKTLLFMSSHTWITEAARELRDAKKLVNRMAVERRLGGLEA